MKYISLAFLSIISAVAALQQPLPATNSRRSFLTQSSVAVASMALIPSAAMAKNEYSVDVEETVVPKKVAVEGEGGNGGLIVGGALTAGLALSLPFFAPNLARMAGVKNAKTPK